MAAFALGWWLRSRRPPETGRRGLDSLDVPPPVPCSCPEEHWKATLVEGGEHIPPCAFAGQPGGLIWG